MQALMRLTKFAHLAKIRGVVLRAMVADGRVPAAAFVASGTLIEFDVGHPWCVERINAGKASTKHVHHGQLIGRLRAGAEIARRLATGVAMVKAASSAGFSADYGRRCVLELAVALSTPPDAHRAAAFAREIVGAEHVASTLKTCRRAALGAR